MWQCEILLKLKRVAILFFVILLCFCLTTCEKCGITEPNPGYPVTLSFDVYNHMNGYETSFSRNASSGDSVVIKISDLEVSGVDEYRIAIRGSDFSELIVFDQSGEATFTAPEEDTKFNIILFNTIPGLDYEMMDRQNSHLYNATRHYTVYRKDFDGCPKKWEHGFGQEKPWRITFEKCSAALDRGWVKWGSFQRKPAPNDDQGDFSYGYSECKGYWGWHSGSSITLNACSLSDLKSFLTIGLAEIFENVTSVDNNGIDGSGGSYDVMTDANGNLNEIGENLLVYVFAKDPTPVSIE